MMNKRLMRAGRQRLARNAPRQFALLEEDVDAILQAYLKEEPDRASGGWSITFR